MNKQLNETNLNEKDAIDAIFQELERLNLDNITLYELKDRSPIADYFFLANAESQQQIDAAQYQLAKILKEIGYHYKNNMEKGSQGWLLMDFSDIIIHVFLEEKRLFFNLDKLYREITEQ